MGHDVVHHTSFGHSSDRRALSSPSRPSGSKGSKVRKLAYFTSVSHAVQPQLPTATAQTGAPPAHQHALLAPARQPRLAKGWSGQASLPHSSPRRTHQHTGTPRPAPGGCIPRGAAMAALRPSNMKRTIFVVVPVDAAPQPQTCSQQHTRRNPLENPALRARAHRGHAVRSTTTSAKACSMARRACSASSALASASAARRDSAATAARSSSASARHVASSSRAVVSARSRSFISYGGKGCVWRKEVSPVQPSAGSQFFISCGRKRIGVGLRRSALGKV